MNTITIPVEETPAYLRQANAAGATVLELIRDLAATRGDQVTHRRARALADALATATANAAEFIEARYPPAPR